MNWRRREWRDGNRWEERPMSSKTFLRLARAGRMGKSRTSRFGNPAELRSKDTAAGRHASGMRANLRLRRREACGDKTANASSRENLCRPKARSIVAGTERASSNAIQLVLDVASMNRHRVGEARATSRQWRQTSIRDSQPTGMLET